MSVHVFLNLLNLLRKIDKMQGCIAFDLFLAKSFKISIMQEQCLKFYLSYDIYITFKSYFGGMKKFRSECCYQHHYMLQNM